LTFRANGGTLDSIVTLTHSRLVTLLGFAGVLALVPSAHGAPEDWKSLPYFSYERYELFAATDDSWHNAKEVGAAYPVGARNRPPWARERAREMKPIWLSKCKFKQQVAKLSLPVMAPGPASEGSVYFELLDPNARSRPKAVKLLINGQPAAKMGKRGDGVQKSLSSTALALFRFGINKIQIVATKPQLPPTGTCNRGRRSEKIGIFAAVFAGFQTDLSVSNLVKKEYSRATLGEERTTVINIGKVGNAGPAASVAGGFGFYVRTGNYVDLVSLEATAPPPFGSCVLEVVQARKAARLTCLYADLASRYLTNVKVTVKTRSRSPSEVPSSFTTSSANYTWVLAPGDAYWNSASFLGTAADADPDWSTTENDNAGEMEEVFCFREPANDPGCAGADR
jgi:hypothetical protein